MKTPALLSAALLLLLQFSWIPAARLHKAEAKLSEHNKGHQFKTVHDQTPITVLVTDSVTHTPNKTYSTYVVFRGILLGGLMRLQSTTKDFRFTYTQDLNYGPFLESVNGLPGCKEKRTYWQLLVNTTKPAQSWGPKPNPIIIPDVGIGCYIPNANDQIILKYTKY